VEFAGSALVVKDLYQPKYQRIKSFGDNHIFSIPVTSDHAFEYMIAGAWSEGVVYNTPELFRNYVKATALEYNNPVKISYGLIESK
jgi:hypothetical protein